MSCKNSFKLAKKLNVVGNTIDNKKVLSNSFIFMSTLGLPFNILLEELEKKNFVIDWIDFCECALKDGWKRSTIINKITEASIDVYSLDYRKELLRRLNYLLYES